MAQDSVEFYDLFAAQYHLIVDDWESEIHRMGELLTTFLPPSATSGTILDCACGIGTQALALARLGYRVDGSDLSPGAVDRTRPWLTLDRNSGRMTPKLLSDRLRPFGIAPQNHKVPGGGGEVVKGYRLSQFEETFERYLTPLSTRYPATNEAQCGSTGSGQVAGSVFDSLPDEDESGLVANDHATSYQTATAEPAETLEGSVVAGEQGVVRSIFD